MTPGASFSDSLCFGTNLSGNYENNVSWKLELDIDLGSLLHLPSSFTVGIS
jgi:hypothetical protein